MQPLQAVEQRLGNELEPSEIHQTLQGRVHFFQVVVIFRPDIDAQPERAGGRSRRNFRQRFGSSLLTDLNRLRSLPVARLERSRRGAARRKKHSRKVSVLDANKVFPTLPQTRAPLVEVFELLVRVVRDFSAFAVVRSHPIDRSRISYRAISKSAEPRKSRIGGVAVPLGGGFHAHEVAVIEVKMFRNFQLAVTPGELHVGGCIERACGC